MIQAIYYAGLLAAILVNLAALTLVALRFIPYSATARAAGVVALCLAAFSLEHFVGLGRLFPLFLPLTALSLLIIWHDRERFRDPSFRMGEIVFLCAVLYGLLWRAVYPDIVEDNDRLTDFHLVANYLAGDTLPPLDHWLPYQKLNYYYTFQHYSAALLGRIFGLGPGVSFNMAAVILAALVLALAWEILTLLLVRPALKVLAVAALAIGGTGVAPLFHFIISPDANGFNSFYQNSRFIGWFETAVASDTWLALFGETRRSVLLPIETFGFQYAIGGYHAVLSGFLLLFLALAVMVAIPQASRPVRARLEFLLGVTVPLTLCANAWVFPFQAALIAAWKVRDWLISGNRNLFYLALGAAIGILLLLPALVGLGAASTHMRLHLVPWGAHVPLKQFIVVFWPLLVLTALIPLAGLTWSLGGFFAAFFLGALFLTEFFNVDDQGYAGSFLRFNPALKWWGWLFTGGVFMLSAYLMASSRRAFRVAASLVLILVSFYAVDIARFFVGQARGFSAQFDGSKVYGQNLGNKRMMQVLAEAPYGIVLEKLYEDRPNDTGIYGSFALKPSLMGIPWVLRMWKRDLAELPSLMAEINSFYAGSHPNAARFLEDRNIRYVVWSVRESNDTATWDAIDNSIGDTFRWMEFSDKPDRHIGLWIRR
jgi:hypothetical protein